MALKWTLNKLPEDPITRWAIGLNLWVLACIYCEWTLGYLLEVNWLLWLLWPIWVVFRYFSMFFIFIQFHITVIIFSICMALMGFALIRARSRPRTMLSLLLFLLAYAAWPLTVEKYEPAIEPLVGYKMQLVTDTGYFGTAIKSKLRRYEGTTCNYELLGWDERNMLYYESNCFGKKRWRYDPISRQNLSISRIPAQTELTPAGPRSTYGKKIAQATVFQEYGLLLYVDGYTYSEDGQWAAMESKRIYSVHDVVVFSKE